MDEKSFDKYSLRGNRNWEEMMSWDFRIFNAYQQARYDWILRIVGDVRGKKILDLGCGGGSLTYLLAKNGAEVVGVENDELGLQFARRNLQSIDLQKKLRYSFTHASAYKLPMTPESFDIVVSCEVIEHLLEPERMLAEASRVLRHGGRIILTTPYRLTEFPQDSNHVKEYYPGELEVLLKKNFSNVEIKQTHHLMWRSMYAYTFRYLRDKRILKWAINLIVLVTGWNPFMIDYKKPKKLDAFSTLIGIGVKQ